jgi:hypothetical protein
MDLLLELMSKILFLLSLNLSYFVELELVEST